MAAKEQWGHQLDYFLTLMGYTVGVGAVWKFPYMCARNGGGSFLIPYLLFSLVGTMPMVYLEMFIGQYSQGGPVSVWNLCPALRGVGVGTVLISWLFATYYPVLFAWILYYFAYSFFPTLPWTECDREWNSVQCVNEERLNNRTLYNLTIGSRFGLNSNDSGINISTTAVTAAEEFFRKNVLDMSDGIENMGEMRWPLVGALAVLFFIVYMCMIKGIKLSGKIVYVTVTCPYILITVFLIRGCMLPGAIDGIMFYITPDFNRLLDPMVWIEACNINFFTMGVSYGFLITMSAHNPIKNNCFRDSLFTVLTAIASQIFFGFAVFAITGHVAYQQGVPVTHFETSGFKLGFITYPEAASYLPIPQMWSVCLFVMLFTLGIDSLVPSFEVVTTMFGEFFPQLTKRRWLLNGIVLLPSFLLGLPYMTQGGVYLLTLVEWYAFFPATVLFAMLECIAVAWIYGVQRMDKINVILWGKHLSKGISIQWRFISPVLLLVIFGYSLYSYRPPQFEEYVFPAWATGFGWCISFASILPIPVVLVWSIRGAEGDTWRQKLTTAFKPKKRWNTHEVQDDSVPWDVTDSEEK